MLTRALLLTFALATGFATAGCTTYRYVATDGAHISGDTVFESKPAAWIVTRSARHDIPCASAAVVSDGSLDRDWMVEGCGQRVTYRFVISAENDWDAVLVTRVVMCNSGRQMSPDEMCAAPLARTAR